MLTPKKLIVVMLLPFSLALMGFDAPPKDLAKLPVELSDELEEIAGFRFSHVVFIDTLTGSNQLMVHVNAEQESESIVSEIKKITSVSVIGVSDINVHGRIYQSCNYIDFDGKTTLICDKGSNPAVPDPQIEDFPGELAQKIEKSSGISNVGFMLLTHIQNGQTKLVKHENYVSFHDKLPQPISDIKNRTIWSVVTLKKNPCCQDVIINGSWQRVCDRTIPACP